MSLVVVIFIYGTIKVHSQFTVMLMALQRPKIICDTYLTSFVLICVCVYGIFIGFIYGAFHSYS